jgi:hypothetical protein
VRRPLLALTALAFAAAIASGGPPGASAGVAAPSVAACALGTSAPDLRGFAARELARAQRRVRGGRRARRAFTAAAAAYLYGVAPLSVGQTVQRFPENRMLSIGALVDPTVKTVVAPNVDTTYTVAQLNLAAGPLVIDVPDTRGRYYVLQLLDAYSNTFRYVGRRTTGTGAGSYALVPPAFSGALPPGVRRITSPTPLVWLLGRTLVQGAADLPSVTELMRGYRVTPLAEWSAGAREPPLVLPAFPPNQTRLVLPKGLAFFDALGAYLAANPPPARDACALRVFARAGIGAGRTPSSASDGAVRRALGRAAAMAERLVSRAVARANVYSRKRNNGWLVPLGYVGDYGRNYLGRAVIAKFALGANTPEETIYPSALTDSRGRPLSGHRRYTLRFPPGELPPVGAFWSLTMYDRSGYLNPNAIGRYAIGDRTRGLRRGSDNSLTLYVQRRAPGGRRRANWLPAPRGRFRLIMRLYEPRRRASSGDWRPPPVRRH